MNNKTTLYYILSAQKYYQYVKNRIDYRKIKNEVDKEIEYFFDNRHVRRESWNKPYFKILTAVFSVNLISRYAERYLFKFHTQYFDKCSSFPLATLIALKTYNNNRSFFNVEIDNNIFLPELINSVNSRVNLFFKSGNKLDFNFHFLRSNTPMGIELEFSNQGSNAGYFFKPSKEDPLLNFSKYHYYHLLKFMWRFGAYVDSNTPFKQFIKKGGFLEYTFTRPDIMFKPSAPLTYSPQVASELIREAVRFTPIKPHSLHTTYEISGDIRKLKKITFDELLFIIIASGHFFYKQDNLYETRLTEGNMKDIINYRDRRNDSGWVKTVEFTYMRLCRDFVRRNIYEASILLQIAYKNMFSLVDIDLFHNLLVKWGKKPELNIKNFDYYIQIVEKGLDKEVSLPVKYKERMMMQIKDNFYFNKKKIEDSFE